MKPHTKLAFVRKGKFPESFFCIVVNWTSRIQHIVMQHTIHYIDLNKPFFNGQPAAAVETFISH